MIDTSLAALVQPFGAAVGTFYMPTLELHSSEKESSVDLSETAVTEFRWVVAGVAIER